MTRTRRTVLFAVAVLASAGATLSPAASAPAAAASGCRLTAQGPPENRWLGGAGSWSDATRWSQGVVPGTATRDHACLPPGSDVVVDTTGPARVDLDLLELGRGAHLTLQPGTALYVWGDQQTLRSVVRDGALLTVDGASFGGGGRLRVMGTLDVHRSSGGSAAALTSRPVSSPSKGRKGLLEVADDGVLDVHGHGDVRLARKYVVDVRGVARFREQAGLVADHGTAMLLQEQFYGHGVGRLVILDDRGFAEGRYAHIKHAAVFLNDGRIVKRDSAGTSTIEGTYLGGGQVVQKSGTLVRPVPTAEGSPCDDPVSCGADPTKAIPQTASIELPATDTSATDVTIEPLKGETVPGALGVPMKVHAAGMEATFADPAVIELHYDASLFAKSSTPPDPAKIQVGHANGAGTGYDDIPSCEGQQIPLGAFACLDVAASSKAPSGDVVLVVRTVDTSRWIAF